MLPSHRSEAQGNFRLESSAATASPRFHILEAPLTSWHGLCKNVAESGKFRESGTPVKQRGRSFRERRTCGGGRDEIGNGNGHLEKAMHRAFPCVFPPLGMGILPDTGIQLEFGQYLF